MLYNFSKINFLLFIFRIQRAPPPSPYVAAPLDEDFLNRQLWNIHIPESTFLLLDI